MTSDSSKHPISEHRLDGLTLLKKNNTQYDHTPEQATLETFQNVFPNRNYFITFDCPEFTSLCPVTGQPDFGHIIITYIANERCVESKSLKLHLFSYRNHNAFHEEVVNLILDAVVDACAPRWARVQGVFNPRGGIAIHVEAIHGVLPENVSLPQL